MHHDQRRFDRTPVAVPCTICYQNDSQNPAQAQIINLSPGGIMLASEQGFITNQRVAITLDDGTDSLLFEFAEILTGTVRWSQAVKMNGLYIYHVGVALERELPPRIILTEQ